MNDFAFQNATRVYFGKNQLSRLPEEISWVSKSAMSCFGKPICEAKFLMDSDRAGAQKKRLYGLAQ